MSGLSDANQAALSDFSKFSRRRREATVAEVAAEFKETREMRLFEDSYTKDEVEAMVDGLLALVRTTLGKELKSTGQSSLLLLKQLLEQAESAGVKVGFDITRAQDKGLLKEVEAWEASLSNGAGLQLKARAGGGAPKQLGTIGTAQDAGVLMVRRSGLTMRRRPKAAGETLPAPPQPHPLPTRRDHPATPTRSSRA